MSAHVSAYLRTLLPAVGGLSVPARHLADTLGHYANRHGVAWCSVKTLAERTGMHPGTIRRARGELVAAGIIAVDLSAGGRMTATNTYRFPVTAFVHTPRGGRGVAASDPASTARDPALRTRLPRVEDATKIHEESIEAPATASADTIPLWWAERFGYLTGTDGPT